MHVTMNINKSWVQITLHMMEMIMGNTAEHGYYDECSNFLFRLISLRTQQACEYEVRH